MVSLDTTLDRLNWADIALQLDAEGHAVLPGLLGADVARKLAQQTTAPGARRMILESGDWGRGEWFYCSAGMPAPLELWRTAFYRRLVVIANRWNEALGIAHRYPAELEDFLSQGCPKAKSALSGDSGPRAAGQRGGTVLRHNRKVGQASAQSHLSRLGVEDYVALHQRNDGGRVFPLQIVAVLSEPGVDFQGGEFVMTEQRPRMQSRPMVVPLKLGDAALIATAERPFKGTKGYYRVNLKHAISRVRQGERIGLELSFHEAP